MASDSMLGRLFGLCGSDEQAEFLNAAGKSLRRAAEDNSAIDMQCCWIVDHLDDAGRDLVKRLAAFIEHDETTPRVEKRVVYEDVIVRREVEEPPEEAP
jgi:hypothetical protein